MELSRRQLGPAWTPSCIPEDELLIPLAEFAPALISGAAVGLVLGLVGGGGSILAVPLLVYFVGVRSPHVALGTSAVAVALNAAVNLYLHARRGNVKWRCAALFSFAGVLGAWAGATAGKATGGQRLLVLFGGIMILVAVSILRRPTQSEEPEVRLDARSAGYLGPRLVVAGLLTGAVSGFFGIGGGFLIVPALVYSTHMPMIFAVGSSLLAVTAFGLTTAISYSASGLVDWTLAILFIVGGLLGGLGGTWLAVAFSHRRRLLSTAFAAVVMAVGTYVVVRGWNSL